MNITKNLRSLTKMTIRISFEDMIIEFTRILTKKGMEEKDARESAEIFAENSLDGIYSHGVNRFPRVIEYIDKGYIDLKARPELISGFGAFERWSGNLYMGNITAKRSMERAIELAKQFGIGIVALSHTNHWMRGGTYGLQAADAGMVGILWTNTMPNMPAWGALDNHLGNNPFIISIPRNDGNHVMVDMAMSQFSYGKIEEMKLAGKDLPVPGGFDTKGNITRDPKEIEKTNRVLPVGYWKGSAFSHAIDIAAGVLSGGYTTAEVGFNCEDEYDLSQIFIAINPRVNNNGEEIERIIDFSIKDLKKSKVEEGSNVYYPNELSYMAREDNLKNGIPVVKDIWETIVRL